MKYFLFIIVLFVTAASCASMERNARMNKPTDTEAVRQETSHISPPAKVWKIEYRVSGGFAGIRRTLELSSDGKLIATDLKQKKTVEKSISDKQIASIENLLNTTNYQQTTEARSKLSNRCADCFQHAITVTIDERQHSTAGTDVSLRNSPYASLIGALAGFVNTAFGE